MKEHDFDEKWSVFITVSSNLKISIMVGMFVQLEVTKDPHNGGEDCKGGGRSRRDC